MLVRALVIVGILVGNVAAEAVTEPSCGPPATRARKAKSVRDVDWCNFGQLGGFKGELREGRSKVHLYAKIGQPHDTIAVALRGIVYGDLDGDKRPEVALVLERTMWNGRTGKVTGGTSVIVYGFAKGAPVRLGSMPAGSPVTAIAFTKRTIAITSGAPTATMRFRHDGSDFVEAP